MKRLLFVLFLIPFLSFGQTKTKVPDNFYLENANVYYQNVYEFDSIQKEALTEKLMVYFSAFPGVRNVQKTGDLITGDLHNYIIDYKKLGGSWSNTWAMLNHPMTGKFNIQIKDGRYKLLITDMLFSSNPYVWAMKDMVTKKKGSEFTSSVTAIKGLQYMHQDFTETFKIKETSLKSDW